MFDVKLIRLPEKGPEFLGKAAQLKTLPGNKYGQIFGVVNSIPTSLMTVGSIPDAIKVSLRIDSANIKSFEADDAMQLRILRFFGEKFEVNLQYVYDQEKAALEVSNQSDRSLKARNVRTYPDDVSGLEIVHTGRAPDKAYENRTLNEFMKLERVLDIAQFAVHQAEILTGYGE